MILASRSPRRRDGLQALRIAFDVAVSDVESTMAPPPDPCDPVPVAVAKVLDVAARDARSIVILGADTIVADGAVSLGKPLDRADAFAMLRRLRGRDHVVRTGVALRVGQTMVAGEIATMVRMREYGDAAISAYVATGESLDCAGGYDARSGGASLVEPVTGCLSAVVGFPVVAISRILGEMAGVHSPIDPVVACSALCNAPCRAGNAATAHACDMVLR